jgi:hypothetical protein
MPAVLKEPHSGHGSPGSRSASRSVGWLARGTGAAGSLAASTHQHCEQALDLVERPGRGPAEGAMRAHSVPLLERQFD